MNSLPPEYLEYIFSLLDFKDQVSFKIVLFKDIELAITNLADDWIISRLNNQNIKAF